MDPYEGPPIVLNIVDAGQDIAVAAAASAALAAGYAASARPVLAATVAALMAMPSSGFTNGTPGQVVGHASVFDRGGRDLIWSASSNATHDGALVIKPTDIPSGPGRWLTVIKNDEVSPHWWGCPEDGVSDCAAAINAAAATDYDVRFARIAYVINSTIGDSFVGQKFIGAGILTSGVEPASSLQWGGGSGGKMFLTSNSDITLERINFNAGLDADYCVWNDDIQSFRLRAVDCRFGYAAVGGVWTGDTSGVTSVQDTMFTGCMFIGNADWGLGGIMGTGRTHMCTFIGNGVGVRAGVASGYRSSQDVFTQNDYDIKAETCQHILVSGAWMERSNVQVLQSTGPSNSTHFLGCIFHTLGSKLGDFNGCAGVSSVMSCTATDTTASYDFTGINENYDFGTRASLITTPGWSPNFFFHATGSSNVSNATGDGTEYGITGWTEQVDHTTSFSAGVYTAPRTGWYSLEAQIAYDNVGSGHTVGEAYFDVNGTVDVLGQWFNAYANARSDGFGIVRLRVIVPLTAGDTVALKFKVSGSTKTISVLDGTNNRTWFSCRYERDVF